MRKIKKYANRKLYDTIDKQYISLENLSSLIKDGEAVEIIDNTTGEDITSAVVSQLLAKEQKEKEEVPSSILIGLLRKGSGTVSDYAKKSATLWKAAKTTAEEEIDKALKTLVKNKDISSTEASHLRKELAGYLDSSRKWVAQQVDHRIKDILGAMNLASREQVAELSDKLDALSEKVDQMGKTGDAGRKTEPKVEPKPPEA